MFDDDKTFSSSLVLNLRIWWRHVHTLYGVVLLTTCMRLTVLIANKRKRKCSIDMSKCVIFFLQKQSSESIKWLPKIFVPWNGDRCWLRENYVLFRVVLEYFKVSYTFKAASLFRWWVRVNGLLPSGLDLCGVLSAVCWSICWVRSSPSFTAESGQQRCLNIWQISSDLAVNI